MPNQTEKKPAAARKDSIPIINVGKPKDDDSKINTAAIVLSVIGGVAILGGIISFIIYYNKKVASANPNTNIKSDTIENLKI